MKEPEFGYDAPKWTKRECAKPEMMDKQYHRIGRFAGEYHADGIAGYSVSKICVGCGREFGSIFIPSKRIHKV